MNHLRKFFCLALNLLITQFVLTGQAPQNNVQQKILFSIGKGEKPLSNGSILALSPIGTSVTVLTSDEYGNIYVYANGTKTGPFKDVAGTGITMPKDDLDEYDPVLQRESDPDYEKYIQYNESGGLTLSFGGKSYGPFQFILEFYTTSDKTAFSAIVMKEGKPQIITSTGNKIELDGQPAFTHASSSGRKMMVTVVKENNGPGELMNMEKPGIKPGEAAKNPQEMKGNQTMPPEAFIWFQDGKKFGPYDPRKINAVNPSFNKTGGDNWLLTMNSRLFINGILVKDLINSYISPANVWLTEDGKRYVILVYNRIEFSDGKIYTDPLKIRISVNRNNITIWWLLLEKDKDIVLYSRTI
jgi:hypothetical protein